MRHASRALLLGEVGPAHRDAERAQVDALAVQNAVHVVIGA
jgi:hypothetical protein